MRRFLICLALPAVLLVSKSARAEAVKIGYVDVQRAVQEVDEGKAARTRLQGEVDEARKKVEAQQSAFTKMKADYDKQASVLSDDAKKKKQDELQKAYLEMQQGASDLKESIDKKEQAAMGSISQRMLQVIAEISDRDGLAYVLDKQALLFAPPAADVTNEVIRRYNEKFSVAGAGADSKATAKSNKK